MKRNVRGELLSKVWCEVESSYEDFAKSEAISFDEYCFLLVESVKKKQKPSQVVITDGLLPVLNPVVLSFLDLESILSGSVFLVCKDWHNQLINSEVLWKSIFYRLSQSIVDFSNSFTGWPIQQLHNESFNMFIPRKNGSDKVSVMFPKLDTWQAQKEYCLTKYCSYRKSVKLGNVKSYFCTTHDHTTYLDMSTIKPSLYTPFHITANNFAKGLLLGNTPQNTFNDEILYISSSDDGDGNKVHSFMNISLDYFSTTNFTMNIKIDNTVESHDSPKFNMDITVKQLNSSNDSEWMQLFKLGSFSDLGDNEEDYDGEGEGGEQEEGEGDEGDVKTNNGTVLHGHYLTNLLKFRSEWIGETEETPRHWLSTFLGGLGIPALNEALYRCLDHVENY